MRCVKPIDWCCQSQLRLHCQHQDKLGSMQQLLLFLGFMCSSRNTAGKLVKETSLVVQCMGPGT
jgi:hypothetical protein